MIAFGGHMTHAKMLLVLALATASVKAYAGSEMLAAGAERAFTEAAFVRPLPAPKNGAWKTKMLGQIVPNSGFTTVVPGAEDAQGAGSEVASLDLPSLLNRQLKSQLKYTLGGKTVWISGAFDRKKTAYVSILIDGSEPAFYELKGLIDKEQPLRIGTGRYKLYVAPNVINQIKSEIILENEANEDDLTRITVKKMLDGVGSMGEAVKVADQTYKVFYTDDFKEGKPDKTVKLITFILTETSGSIHLFLIPAEFVPADRIAVFKMFQDKRVGLAQKDGKLKIYDNP
ncbi:MAG: hypothetical protein HYZ74_05650 [Elusimicrobia bacterium]|nr:hypothetical protein [Elusimicrobiota bacterium]